jgi:hypothetical protein
MFVKGLAVLLGTLTTSASFLLAEKTNFPAFLLRRSNTVGQPRFLHSDDSSEFTSRYEESGMAIKGLSLL